MKLKVLRWLFSLALGSILVAANLADPLNIGVSAESVNDRYHFRGGTSPWALGFSLLVVSLYVTLMYASSTGAGGPFHGVFRRFVAFWLHFILGLTAVAPILGFLPAITEWRRTGVFEWSFERTTQAKGDWLVATIGTFLAAAFLLLFYTLPLVRRKPSPGSCIVGYQVVPDEGTTLNLQTALLRTVLGFIAACTAYLAPFVARDRERGKFWLDKAFDTHAVKLS